MTDAPTDGQQAAPEIVVPKATSTAIPVDVPAVTTETPAPSEEIETPPDDGAEPEPRKRRGVQKRIDELTAEREDARRDRDHWRDLAQTQLKPKGDTAADGELKEPKEQDYTSYDDFLTKRDDYLIERSRRATLREVEGKQREAQTRATQAAEATRFKDARDRFEKSADDVAANYEGFDEAMEDLWSGKIQAISKNDTIAEFIIEVSDRGPELAYHLHTNPKEAERIAKLSPLAAVRELTRIEAAMPKPETRTISKAPAPAKPVKATGGPATKDVSALADNMAEYSAHRKAERAARNA